MCDCRDAVGNRLNMLLGADNRPTIVVDAFLGHVFFYGFELSDRKLPPHMQSILAYANICTDIYCFKYSHNQTDAMRLLKIL